MIVKNYLKNIKKWRETRVHNMKRIKEMKNLKKEIIYWQ